ncbi:TPA: DNA methyltransferase [Clostridioides difficile]
MDKINKLKERIANIEATNKNDIYSSNLYWSQKPFNICDEIIEHLSEDGDIIFDPFMGSGVTVIEALKKEYKRNAIGCDINDAPIFIVKTLLEKYNVPKIEKDIKELNNKLSKLSTYYSTKCRECGEVVTISKTIFDKENRNAKCELKSIHYKCKECKNDFKGEPNETEISKFFIDEELKNIDDFQFIANSRLAVGEGDTVRTIFSNRNLIVLDKILGHIDEYKNSESYEPMKYILLSILHLSKITDTHSNSQWPLWIPKKDCVEKNVVELFIKNSKKTIKALKLASKYLCENRENVELIKNLDRGKFKLIKDGVQNIEDDVIPNEFVDLIITDPPYMGQVLYSEYMQLYKPFMDLEFELENEIVISSAPARDKGKVLYFDMMNSAFENISRVLKVGKYMCMYFHDSNLDVWDNIIDIMTNNNLKYMGQIHVSKNKNTLKNILSPKKSLNGDCIIFFKKDLNINYDINEVDNIEDKINNIAQAIIDIKEYASTPELYDNGALEYIISNGKLKEISKKYKDLTSIFEQRFNWDKERGVWTV